MPAHLPATISVKQLSNRRSGALFRKWTSDTWEYEHAQAVGDYGDDLTDEIEADYHQFDLPAEASWKTVTNKTANIGHQIAVAFRKIEQANPQTLAGDLTEVLHPCTLSLV